MLKAGLMELKSEFNPLEIRDNSSLKSKGDLLQLAILGLWKEDTYH